jgi:hypothetical protein
LKPNASKGDLLAEYLINVSPEFYEDVISSTFERGGVFYILPDTAELAETFPEFVQSRGN